MQQEEWVFCFEKNLQNAVPSYKKLIELYQLLDSERNRSFVLDFTHVSFLSANLLAVLGCCVENTMVKRNHRIKFRNLHPKIKNIMRKNGFNRYFTWENLEDRYHSTMDYALFEANTEKLVDFEKKFILKVFRRSDIPFINIGYKNCIIDNLLEMFNNVIDHADSKNVYVCGQFFPRSNNLTFSIVDIGNTIQENVKSYMWENKLKIPENSLEWAILPGHSTKAEEAPGGLGFSTLLQFLRLNKGEFILISW